MPNTLIREGYLDSDRVSALSDFDDRVFFRVLLAADDAGRTDGRTDKLRSALFPTRENVRSVDVEKAVSRLMSAGLLDRWEWESKPVIQVMRWQRRSGAQYSKFPGPDGSFRISWVEVETRDGKQAFSASSLSGSATHRKPIDNPLGGVSEKSPDTNTETETILAAHAPRAKRAKNGKVDHPPSPPARKVRAAPTGPAAEFERHFRAKWEERYGKPCAWRRGKDDRHNQWIREHTTSLAEAKAIVDRFMSCDDKFASDARHTLGVLVSQFERHQIPDENDGTFTRVERSDDEILSVLKGGDAA